MEINTVCIIGAGAMGTGIAQVAAQVGIRVCLVDVSKEALDRSREALSRALAGAVEREKLTPEQAEETRALISWRDDLDALAEADWVIEAVFEDRQVKAQVLREAGARAREGVPIASNTSTFPIGEMARHCGKPQWFLGMHFFNPPAAMRFVEIVPTDETLPEVTAAAVALCERMGKTPLVVPDIPGFVVNRAFGALVAAAVDILAQGAEPEVIDTAIELGLGHRMGPLRTADLVGLDIMLALLRSLHEQTGDGRFEPPPRLIELVESGKLGGKSGEGFYKH